MDLESARRLKRELLGRAVGGGAAVLAGLLRHGPRRPLAPPVALGIEGRRGDYRLAALVHRREPGLEATLEAFRRAAGGEMVVRRPGWVVFQDLGDPRRARPLLPGASLGRAGGPAGSLGAVVRIASERRGVLGSAHVLAAGTGPVLQPAPEDGGRDPADRVAVLSRAVAACPQRRNRLDAAVAELVEGTPHRGGELPGLGRISGVGAGRLETGTRVFKVGRTTRLTRGRVGAFEVDDLAVCRRAGAAVFDGQIEIRPWGDAPFSLPGDSGALVVDEARRAVGMLFAGNALDASFAHPLGRVLERLGVTLVGSGPA